MSVRLILVPGTGITGRRDGITQAPGTTGAAIFIEVRKLMSWVGLMPWVVPSEQMIGLTPHIIFGCILGRNPGRILLSLCASPALIVL